MSVRIIRKFCCTSGIGIIVGSVFVAILTGAAMEMVKARGWLAQTNQNEPLQSFRIRIRPWGIEPKQALLRHEEVNLILDDTTGTAVTIIFERRGVGKTAEIGPSQKRHGARKIKLAPGEYEFYVAGRPQERAYLTVLRPNQ